MRVLFTTSAVRSYLLTLAPLAWALRTAGHEVRVAARPGFADVITQAGLTAVPVGSDRDPWARVSPERIQAARPGLRPPYDAAGTPRDEVAWERLKAGYDREVTWWHKAENVPVIAGLVDFARHWRPDLVLWEPTSYAGAIAAKAVGAAHGRLLWGTDVFGVTREHFLRLREQRPPEDRADPLADWLGANARHHGAEYSEDMATGQFTIDQLPASLALPTGLHRVPLRYTPHGGAAVVPRWLREDPRSPRVALTFGLAATDSFGGYTVPVQSILDTLGELDVEVVATIGDEQKRALDRIPPNARVVPYVPLHDLAPTCAAVVHHAGAATLATVSLHGVPQLSLPFHFDEPIVARALAAQGAGLTLPPDQVTGTAVRDHLLRLLTEPGFGERAHALRAELLAMPGPGDLVGALEELTAKHRVTAA
ncbi:glycosyltransferase (activator-dependent family) [Saccharothrix australiensis]|uniref:Glycosyltransferase (Activator-dependent family) n=1 Tax=Saccharothrix australiensis TaxID=2072 RepID=A0A495W4G5_9PSEU|nr:activator-dependent family glycosyltransferase [Saccharothrix australiensis]RKT54698.1 glycosyltransferase (activator-dependent family) [Saccharothrix australiensis]